MFSLEFGNRRLSIHIEFRHLLKWSKVIGSPNKIYVFVDLGLGLINDAFQKIS